MDSHPTSAPVAPGPATGYPQARVTNRPTPQWQGSRGRQRRCPLSFALGKPSRATASPWPDPTTPLVADDTAPNSAIAWGLARTWACHQAKNGGRPVADRICSRLRRRDMNVFGTIDEPGRRPIVHMAGRHFVALCPRARPGGTTKGCAWRDVIDVFRSMVITVFSAIWWLRPNAHRARATVANY